MRETSWTPSREVARWQMATYLVRAVLVEGQSVREVARDHGVSKTWLYELFARYQAEGEAGLEPRSRRPHRSPSKIAGRFEDEIVRIRKELTESGFDAGAETIGPPAQGAPKGQGALGLDDLAGAQGPGLCHPRAPQAPEVLVDPLLADLPNERWQMDVTHVRAGRRTGGGDPEHHRRPLPAVRGLGGPPIFKAIDVVTTFHEAAARWGFPAGVLERQRRGIHRRSRHGVCVMESEPFALGIAFKHSRPYHPQTCGKVERFHQTLKKYLAPTGPADHRCSPAPARRLRRLLQRACARTAPLGAGPPTGLSARTRHSRGRPFSRSTALPGPPGQGQRRQSDTALQEPALPRRCGSQHNGRQGPILVDDRDVRILTPTES